MGHFLLEDAGARYAGKDNTSLSWQPGQVLVRTTVAYRPASPPLWVAREVKIARALCGEKVGASRGLSVMDTVRRVPDRDKGLIGGRSLHRQPCPVSRRD